MKTITLKEAYGKATPGPLSPFAVGQCCWIHAQRNPLKPERIPQMEVALMNQSNGLPSLETAAVLSHAFNVLPEAAETLKDASELLEAIAIGYPEIAADTRVLRVRKAIVAKLAKLNTVQIPD